MSQASRPGWWQALNPAIYLVSILPGVGVWLLGRPGGDEATALLAAVTAVVLLQHAINLLNDVSDWRLGADSEKWDSWVRYHAENTRTATLHGWLSFLAGGLLGLGALLYTGKLWILLIALPMVGLGYLYNSGKRPLSYTHLGEWITGLCYGPGVAGCLWLLIGRPVNTLAILAMIAFAALATALLLSHQPPQIETDRQAGKRSFAVRYGEQWTYRGSRILFGIFLLGWGAAFFIIRPGPVALGIVACAAAGAIVSVARTGLNPRRILISATVLMAASLLGAQLSA